MSKRHSVVQKLSAFILTQPLLLGLVGILSFVAVFASVALTQQQQDLRQRAQVDPYGNCTASQSYTCTNNTQYYCPAIGTTPSITTCEHGCASSGRCNAAPFCDTSKCPAGCNADLTCEAFCNKTCGFNEQCIKNQTGGFCLVIPTNTPIATATPSTTCTSAGIKPSENAGQACCSGLVSDPITKICRTPTSGTGGGCVSNNDCNAGLRCSNGRCEVPPTPIPACTLEGQMPIENQGRACCLGLVTTSSTSTCQKPLSGTGGVCTSNAQCNAGLRCTNGKCENPLTSNLPDCQSNSFSSGGTNRRECRSPLTGDTRYECIPGTTGVQNSSGQYECKAPATATPTPTPRPTPVNNRPNGTFCSTNSVCASGYCDTVALKCADKPADYCTVNANCSQGFRCSAQNRCVNVNNTPSPTPRIGPVSLNPDTQGEICGSAYGCICSAGPDTGKRVSIGEKCTSSFTAGQVGTLCSPSARIQCIGSNGLRMCNSTGNGYTDLTCAPGYECRDAQCQRIQSEPTQTPPATTSNKIIENGQTCTGSIFDKCQCGDKTINSGQICVLAITLPSTNRADGAFCSLNTQCGSGFCNTVNLQCATKPTDYCVLNTQCSTDGSRKCVLNTCVEASTVVSVSVNDFLRIPEGSICYGNAPCVCSSGPDIGKTISPGGVCAVTPSNYVASNYTGPYAGQQWLDRTVALIEQGHTLDPITFGTLALYQGFDLVTSGNLSTASNSVAFADEQCANPNVTAAECLAHRLGQVGNIALAAFDVATLGLSGVARNSADNVATSVVRNIENGATYIDPGAIEALNNGGNLAIYVESSDAAIFKQIGLEYARRNNEQVFFDDIVGAFESVSRGESSSVSVLGHGIDGGGRISLADQAWTGQEFGQIVDPYVTPNSTIQILACQSGRICPNGTSFVDDVAQTLSHKNVTVIGPTGDLSFVNGKPVVKNPVTGQIMDGSGSFRMSRYNVGSFVIR